MLRTLRLVRGDGGQTMAEYAVVLGVITLAVVATLGLLNAAILNLLNSVIPLL
jgi:Flp pilus assembly pilin Flp